MADKTSIEANYYNRKASAFKGDDMTDDHIHKSNDRLLRKSHFYYEDAIRKELQKKLQGNILDYGCGPGFKNFPFASPDWKIFGIDISEVSISCAEKLAQERDINAHYQVMDCEKMTFEDSFFDVVLDYGTFSSLDMQKALPDLIRVMKPTASLIAIETFGHNPVTNLKRWISMLTGRRTRWATSHIMKTKDWKRIGLDFNSCSIQYFGFFVIFLGPLGKHCP
ncbi:MAG: class I SAM-dependent methyltransferase, partial [Bacteroidota bacterium]